jgi:DNA modification methylase
MHLAPYYYATAVSDRLRPFFGAPIIWQWGWDHRATTMSKGYEVWFHLARGPGHFRSEGEFCSGVWAIRIDRLDPRLAALGAKDDHYPIEIARRLIGMFSEPGATVLDPFGGTGTTAIAAFELGRNAITNDISPEQTRYAKARFALYRADRGLAAE